VAHRASAPLAAAGLIEWPTASVAAINTMGVEGWEMISFDTVPLTGAFSNNIKGYVYLTFFKRPLPE
jgi:hypothetical protein